MAEVTGNKSTGGVDHFIVTGETLDLFNYTKACKEDPDSPHCEPTLYLAGRSDRQVHSAYVKRGNVEEKKVRPTDGQPGADDDFWRKAQHQVDVACRIYATLIGGLGEALKNGSYDPTRGSFKNEQQAVAVSCRADEKSGNILELTLAYPKDHILIDITDRAALAVFDGKLPCKKSDKP